VTRRGFTLIEIMVALMILSGLIAIMVPVVMDQSRRGDPTRVGGDLNAVSSALNMFRAHTLTVPDDLEDLANPIAVNDRQITAVPYSTSALGRWNGPYLDTPMEERGAGDPFSPDSIPTGFDAFIAPVLALYDGLRNDSLPVTAADDANFVALIIRGLNAEEFERLNDLLDGEAELDGTPGCTRCSYDRGNLRYDPGQELTYYLAIPYRPGS
jgi:prepilin-type N-terminal cleavage/methylation domain-containing protein